MCCVCAVCQSHAVCGVCSINVLAIELSGTEAQAHASWGETQDPRYNTHCMYVFTVSTH